MSIIEIFDLATFFISTFWLLSSIRKIGQNSRFLICALIYVFYIVPMGMDWLYQLADYSFVSDRVGFIWPRRDFLTVLIYDFGLLYILYVILHGKLIKTRSISDNKISKDRNERLCLYLMILFMILPTVATIILVREPGMLYIMQWRELHLYPEDGSYATIERFSYLGISCSIFILFNKRKNKLLSWESLFKILSIIFLYANICIQGKRAILFYAIINLMVMLYIHLRNLFQAKHSYASIKRFAIVAVILVAIGSYAMMTITAMVKTARSGVDWVDKSALYTTARIDFFRDDRVRMAIAYSIHPDEINIVAYPGQTFFGDFMSFIPLNYLQDQLSLKQASYQTRFTHAMLNIDPNKKLDIEENSWMTVSTFAEIISNLGFFLGILIIPWFCLWFVGLIDKHPYPYNALIICCFILLNLFDFTYVSVFIEFTFILCWLYKKNNKARLKNNESVNNRAVA